MADSIIGNMFGVKTPQEMQQDYLNSMMVNPAQMGSQGLLQQLVSMSGNIGAQLGTGAGRMFGGKAPGEVKSAAIEQALKEVGALGLTSEEEKYNELSKRLAAAGFGAEAMQAAQEARKSRRAAQEDVKATMDIAGKQRITRDKYRVVDVITTDPLTLKPIKTQKSVRYTVDLEWNPKTQQYDEVKGSERTPDGEQVVAPGTPSAAAPASPADAKAEKNNALAAAAEQGRSKIGQLLDALAPSAPVAQPSAQADVPSAAASMGRARAEMSGARPVESVLDEMEASMNNPQAFAAALVKGRAMGYSDADLRRKFYERMASKETASLAKRYPAPKGKPYVWGYSGGLFR
jgi:hypothetical protein